MGPSWCLIWGLREIDPTRYAVGILIVLFRKRLELARDPKYLRICAERRAARERQPN